ncbi:kinase-like domain-containing protein [Rhizophagus clarus]|uniref:Kinase-like domain-containing protein n=1 Tax=Rhizophagus clarus TaxID=94130 RepID=A0A8H3KPD9_9GLOM|nr:kinase-like domain-containing protein [Rhizophagus clarus]
MNLCKPINYGELVDMEDDVVKYLRPVFNIKVPQLILNLIKSCSDENPLNRPNAESANTELIKQIEEMEQINSSSSTDMYSEDSHSDNLLNFSKLLKD